MASGTHARKLFSRPARLAAIAPYVWMTLFFLVPFIFVLKISLSQTAIAQPPYVPVFDVGDPGAMSRALGMLSSDNFKLLFSDNLYILSYLRSVFVAMVSTAILLVLGYPVAFAMARLPHRLQPVAMMLVIIPFWTSFLIRIYAWINVLQRDGLLNDLLVSLHIVSAPVVWLSTDSAMYLGIVYSYFPFMILPLYATLVKLMIGQTLWLEFFTNRDWPVASAIAVVLLVLLVVPLVIYDRLQRRQLEAVR
jgi:putrescine transport system permease protein